MDYISILKETFENNKYLKWYINIVTNQDKSNRIKGKGVYYELHHILPKTIFPEYGRRLKEFKQNTVLLTAKEHFIVHWLLIKTCKHKEHYIKLSFALNSFKRSKNNERIYTSSQYEIIRKQFAIANSITKRNQIPWHKGKTKNTDDRLIKLGISVSKAKTGMPSPHKGKPGIAWNKGKTYTTEPCSDERRKKISIARSNSTKKECPFCGKSFDNGNFKQYHGDNCRLNPNIDKEILQKRSLLSKENIRKQKESGTFKSSNERIRLKGLDPHAHNHIIHECPVCGKKGKQPGIFTHIRKCERISSQSSSV